MSDPTPRTYIGHLDVFDHRKQEWSIFKSRLNNYVKANGITTNKECILLTYISEETYRLAKNLLYPKDIESEKFDSIVNAFDNHFKPKRSTFADMAKFYSAVKASDESLEDWLARLRGIAAYCDFDASFERVLRDRFVLGLPDGAEKNKLIEQDAATLTVSKALELAQQTECVRQAKVATADGMLTQAIKEEPVFRVSGWKPRAGPSSDAGANGANRANQAPASGSAYTCSICGMKSHSSGSCRYKNYKCQCCGQKGHLKKVCKNKKGSRVNNVTVNSGTDSGSECEECKMYNLRYVNNKPYMVTVFLNNCKLEMELDSGSGISAISERLWSIKFSYAILQKTNISFCFYNGHKIAPLGYFYADVQYNNATCKLKIYVVSNGGTALAGRDFMTSFGIHFTNLNNLSNTNSNDVNVNKLLERYAELWEDKLGRFNKFQVTLNLKPDAVPRFYKPRPVPFALKDKVELELTRLVDLGVLVPVSYSKYSTPIVPVLKPDGTIRICGDYALTVNKDLEVESYPLPRIEEVFAKLRGGEQFTKIDLKMAYNQIELNPHDGSQDITTICTSRGLFKYTRLVFGLSNAPAIFQRTIETLLMGIEGVVCFLDDICITGPSRDVHMQRLEEVLRRLLSAGLRLQGSKCNFFCDSITYLGYVIDRHGLRSCPKKVEAIKNAPCPTNVKEVKRFIGMVNYYRKFIPNASSILAPLYELTHNEAVWKWTARQQRAFDIIKGELSSDRVLAHFDPEARLVLSVDAGPAGLGAVLAQGPEGQERPLAFASRSLSGGEKNYSQVLKEAAAIAFGVRYFHQYLYGRLEPFVLRTDHKPLLTIFGKKKGISVMVASRLQRFAIYLSAYNYTIQYVPSEKNVCADYFSRAPLPIRYPNDAPDGECTAINFLEGDVLPVTFDDIKAATAADRTLQTVMKYMQHGWPRKITCSKIQSYFRCKLDLEVGQGQAYLLRGHRIVIPKSLRAQLLEDLHKGHFGIVKTKSIARTKMWWPGIDSDIERTIGACHTCCTLRAAPRREPPAAWPRPRNVWRRLHIDYLSIGQKVYLVVIDAFSKWLECLPMTGGTTSRSLIKKLKFLFSTFGLPETIVSDNDVKIKSAEFDKFCKMNRIDHVTSPIYHPASNGLAENSVKTCKKMLKCILEKKASPADTDEQLLEYLFEYRNCPHCVTGLSPAQLMFGRPLRSRLDLLLPTEPVPERSDKKIRDQQTKTRCFHVGDKVWVRNYATRKPRWSEGLVVRTLGRRLYLVSILINKEVVKRHVDQMLKYVNQPSEPQDMLASNPSPAAMSLSPRQPAATVPKPPPSPPVAPVTPLADPPVMNESASNGADNEPGLIEDEFADALSDREGEARTECEVVEREVSSGAPTPTAPATPPEDLGGANAPPESPGSGLRHRRFLRARPDGFSFKKYF